MKTKGKENKKTDTPYRRFLIGALVFSALAILPILISVFAPLFPSWTGFSPDDIPKNTTVTPVVIYQLEKTLWDWLQLLLVPIILAFGGFWLSRTENRYSLELQERREEEIREIEDKRAKESVLQSYLDQMTKLLLEHKLVETDEQAIVRKIARAWTISAFESLDGKGRSIVFRFLYESGLLTYSHNSGPILEMNGVSLSEMFTYMNNFSNINLRRSQITDSYLAEINMSKSVLTDMLFSDTRLEMCDFEDSDFTDSDLGGNLIIECNFRSTRLFKAFMTDTSIRSSDFEGAILTELTAPRITVNETNMKGVNFHKADIEDGSFIETNLESTDFSQSKAIRVNFSGSNLKLAIFKGADVQGAVFYNAILDGADFRFSNISPDQLKQMKSYNGALFLSNEELLSDLLQFQIK
jgi:uncharacterized protein YjbI with pentapeptide repeats